MSQQTYTYIGALTRATQESLAEMEAQAAPVTWDTFRGQVGNNNAFWLCQTLGYAIKWDRRRPKIGQDPEAAFFRSKYKGRRCYFATWRGARFVFVAGNLQGLEAPRQARRIPAGQEARA